MLHMAGNPEVHAFGLRIERKTEDDEFGSRMEANLELCNKNRFYLELLRTSIHDHRLLKTHQVE